MSRIFDRTIGLLAVFAGFLLIFATLSVTVEVIFRYFLNRSIMWVVEVSEYILLWVTFLAAAWVLRHEGHVRMDLLLNRLSSRAQSLLNTITSTIGVFVWLTVVWLGIRVTWRLYETGYFTPTIMEFPKFIITSVIVVGSLLLSIQFMRRAHSNLRDYRASR